MANTGNYYSKNDRTLVLPAEEQNELDALDMIVGLSKEERSYLLSIWRSYPTLVEEEFRREVAVMRDRSENGGESADEEMVTAA